MAELAAHLTEPEFAFSTRGRKTTCLFEITGASFTMLGVPLNCPRRTRRTTIAGDYKVGRYHDSSLDRDRQAKRLVD